MRFWLWAVIRVQFSTLALIFPALLSGLSTYHVATNFMLIKSLLKRYMLFFIKDSILSKGILS